MLGEGLATPAPRSQGLMALSLERRAVGIAEATQGRTVAMPSNH
jgi:hypothetical protein